MERILEQTVTKINRVHEYFCDGCGELLGTSVEYDDGYAPDYNRYEVSFYVPLDCDHSIHGKSIQYNLRGHYCTSCLHNLTSEIQNSLTKLGFTTKSYDDYD